MRLVEGHGINDVDAPTKIVVDGRRVSVAYYRAWNSMLHRAYNTSFHKRKPTYIGTSVCDEWLRFSVFKSWMTEQDWEGKQLDKDILVPRNKIYAPDRCLFVTSQINSLMIDSVARRGTYPVGVSWEKARQQYQVRIRIHGTHKWLGRYETPEEASLVYRDAKSAHIRSIADEQTEPLRSALHRHADLIQPNGELHTMNEDRIKELEIELEELRKKVDGYEYSYWATYDKNPHIAPFNWCRTELNLLQYPVEVEDSHQGFIVTTPTKRKFVVTPNQKWRDFRRSKWYRYKTIDHLMENYLLKND